MSKQTAVEWLAEQMMHPQNFNPYIEQALAMEREQLEKAYKKGCMDEIDKRIESCVEESCKTDNETYKGGEQLNDFYNDLTLLMQKYELTMECRDEYNEDGWCGQQFTLRSKEPVNGRYLVYIEDIGDFVQGFWNAQRKKGGEQ